QGVASAMLEHLVSFARSTDILKVIHLSVRCDNVRAVHVYEKLGFVHIGTYERYMQIDGAFIDVFLMNLYL
ncbi:MAG: GNAT family protein, partial [Bacillota bacterium]|nr:GNAT family protein [Bacillota bacterium]